MMFDIDARIEEWKRSLLDTTKRNRLIKFSTGRGGSVRLVSPESRCLWQRLVVEGKTLTFPWKRDLLGLTAQEVDGSDAADSGQTDGRVPRHRIADLTERCLGSPRLNEDHLLTEFTDQKAAGQLLRLHRTAQESESEHGVSTLYAVFGFLHWYESQDSQDELRSPLVLVPVRLHRDSVQSPWSLSTDGDDPTTNYCLTELLATNFKLKLPEGDESEIDTDVPTGLDSYIDRVASQIKDVDRWRVVCDTAALGLFNFQKLAMWEDLKKNAGRIKSHTLCRAIGGDPFASVQQVQGLIVGENLDDAVGPHEVNQILDSDSSQHEAIEAVKRGANVVIDGPPGTGKSQTIANAIAELLAAGKTVMFVSEKAAALEVVKRRLDECGLGDFCLELHSHKAKKREVAAELGRCLALHGGLSTDLGSSFEELAATRNRLNGYARELHRPREPLGLSAFEVHGELARLDALAEQSRWQASDIASQDAEFLRRAAEALAGLTQCRAVVENPHAHPWRGCKLATLTPANLDDVRFHLGRAAAGSRRLSVGSTLSDLSLTSRIATIDQWQSNLDHARRLLNVPMIPATWLVRNPATAAAAVRGLHDATGQARVLTVRLPEFSAKALHCLSSIDVAALSVSNDSRELLAGGIDLTALSRIKALRDVASRLRSLTPLLRSIDEALSQASMLLEMPRLDRSVRHVGRMANVLRDLAVAEPVPATWWDAAKRAEILGVVEVATKESQAAQQIRSRLATVFSPIAFEPQSLAIVRSALRTGRSFWRWILPGWYRSRKEIACLCFGSLPETSSLVRHLADLADFHKRAECVRQIEVGYQGDLAKWNDGRTDWAATALAVQAVGRYERWGLSARLKAAMTPGGRLDRPALAQAANVLARADAAFNARYRETLDAYQPQDENDGFNRTAQELASQLESDAAAAESEADALGRLCELLNPGRDLAVGTWEVRAADIVALVGYREWAREYAAALGMEASAEELESMDCAAMVATAEELARFLADVASTLTQPAVAALTDLAVRAALEAAVNVADEVLRDGFAESWEFLAGSLFDAAEPLVGERTLRQMSPSEFADWAEARVADMGRLGEWVRYRQVRRLTDRMGISCVVDEACRGQFPIDRAADIFRKRFFGLWLSELYARVPELEEFDSEDHDGRIRRFVNLDRQSLGWARARLRRQLLADPKRPRDDGFAPDSSEVKFILREANKRRNHSPVRKLLAKIPTLLPRLKPCMMMSPLAVSTYLNTASVEFDVVIFDEASQVRPHDAICALYRGRQLVVAGDPKQLPPSDFFARSQSDDPDAGEEEDEGTAGFESLLDVCLSLGLVRKRLRWHYRSRHEGLIAFSNRYFYDGNLVTFPGPDAAVPAIRLARVTDGRFEGGVNANEARRVARLVLDHAQDSPDRSLGVIAFSQAQQNRILDELETLRRAYPEYENYFQEDRSERFFVKNLENVQGDERDVILLSVGYGPDAVGKVAMRFGPLNRKGGERRLNVAVTRARHAMTLVTSMAESNVDLTRTQAEGARLLKAFLDYAERGPAALSDSVTSAESSQFDSPFEQEVFDELTRRGLALHTQVGSGGYRIDMAVVDPDAPGRYLLGVECDGATYHSSATARDRDRLRHAVLEGLGWRLCRIWSTDWLRNRSRQVQRVLDALNSPRPAVPRPPPTSTTIEPKSNESEPTPPPAPAPRYANIEDVPEITIMNELLSALSDYGATSREEIYTAVARRLGFRRTGAKIKDRIKVSLETLVRDNRLRIQEDHGEMTVSVASPSVGSAPA